jgi:DNA topoisomerase-1
VASGARTLAKLTPQQRVQLLRQLGLQGAEELAEAAAGGGRTRGASREPLKVFGAHPETGAEIKLMEGRFGPYLTDGTTNATLPKSVDQAALTLEEAVQLIDAKAAAGPAKKKGRKAPARKTAAKKAPATKTAPKKA